MHPLQTLVLSTVGSRISNDSSSLNLRAGYLLGTETFCAGHLAPIILVETRLAKLNFSSKLRFIDYAYRKYIPEDLESVRQFADRYRELKSIRNKPPDLLIRIKKIEKLIEKDFAFSIERENLELEKAGLLQLRPLLETRELSRVMVAPDNLETPPPDGFPLSAMLAFQAVENDERAGKELLILPYHFYLPIVREPLAKKFGPEAANVPAHSCIYFPGINLLKVDELRIVRHFLQPATAPLREKIQAWMNVVRTKPADGENYFDEHVAPAAQDVQDLIDSHSLLQNLSAAQYHQVSTRFTLAQIPLLHIWEFYKLAHVIRPETENALERIVQQKPELAAAQCPVAIVDTLTKGRNEEVPNPDEVHRKKYIDPIE